jgi:hypothetical protein
MHPSNPKITMYSSQLHETTFSKNFKFHLRRSNMYTPITHVAPPCILPPAPSAFLYTLQAFFTFFPKISNYHSNPPDMYTLISHLTSPCILPSAPSASLYTLQAFFTFFHIFSNSIAKNQTCILSHYQCSLPYTPQPAPSASLYTLQTFFSLFPKISNYHSNPPPTPRRRSHSPPTKFLSRVHLCPFAPITEPSLHHTNDTSIVATYRTNLHQAVGLRIKQVNATISIEAQQAIIQPGTKFNKISRTASE